MKKAEKALTTLDKLYRGCIWLLINLFVLGFLCWGLYSGFVGFRVETSGETTEGSVTDLEVRDGGAYMAALSLKWRGKPIPSRTIRPPTLPNMILVKA